MADIFLSYAREDRAHVERLSIELANRGWSVWWDRQLYAGEAFSNEIELQLKAADCVIVVWSPHSLRSHFVLDEAGVAIKRGTLLPILFHEPEAPLGYRQLQAVNLTDWFDSGDEQPFRELCRAITRKLNPHDSSVASSPPASSGSASRAPTSANNAVTAGVLASLVVLVSLGWFVSSFGDAVWFGSTPSGGERDPIAPRTSSSTTDVEAPPPSSFQPSPDPPDRATPDTQVTEGAGVPLSEPPAPQSPALASLTLRVSPETAIVSLDGERLPSAQQQLDELSPGRDLLLRAKAAGFYTQQTMVRLQPGERRTIELALTPMPTTPTPSRPRLIPVTLEDLRASSSQAGTPAPFSIAHTEISQAHYASLVGERPWADCGVESRDEYPAVCVSWLEAVRFCNQLSRSEGRRPAYEIEGKQVTWIRSANGYRLPSEDEWEFAADAGHDRTYVGTDLAEEACRFANVADRSLALQDDSRAALPCEDGFPELSPVAPRSLRANALGLYGMGGNVSEWIWDPPDDAPQLRGVRGASWTSGPRSAQLARATAAREADTRNPRIGFRIAANPD